MTKRKRPLTKLEKMAFLLARFENLINFGLIFYKFLGTRFICRMLSFYAVRDWWRNKRF